MRIEIEGILNGRVNEMFVGTVTARENAIFDGMVMSDEIGPTPSAAEAYATAMANDAFDLQSDGNQLTAIEQLEAID